MEARHKKIVKVIDDDIYDKLLEILKGSEKFMLAKFYSNVGKKIWRLISSKNVKVKDKFNKFSKNNFKSIRNEYKEIFSSKRHLYLPL